MPSRAWWVVAATLMAANLANTAAWALRYHLSPLVPLLLMLSLFVLARRQAATTLTVLALFALFTVVVLGAPITEWDARSIWFFHAKRIFLDGDLYAQLDDYAPWSHNDYPPLVPALAASVAASAGQWNEILPRLSVLFALFPIFLVFAWLLVDDVGFAVWAGGILLICRGDLLNGYMDAILGLYCAAAVLLTGMAFSAPRENNAGAIPVWLLLLLLVTTTLPLIKNEGLAAMLILSLCILPGLRRWPQLLLVPAVSVAVYFVLWKYPMIRHGIHTHLFEGAVLQRGWSRLSNPSDLWEIAKYFLKHAILYVAVFVLLVVRFPDGARNAAVVAAFIVLYVGAIVGIYLITPHELSWHLRTSAGRTLMVPNVVLLSFAVYTIGARWHNREFVNLYR